MMMLVVVFCEASIATPHLPSSLSLIVRSALLLLLMRVELRVGGFAALLAVSLAQRSYGR